MFLVFSKVLIGSNCGILYRRLTSEPKYISRIGKSPNIAEFSRISGMAAGLHN